MPQVWNLAWTPPSDAIPRFMDLTSPEPNSGCWLWAGGCNQSGYGFFYVTPAYQVRAHRFSFNTFNGPLKKTADVCHRCDTRCCVNPDHLFSGSRAVNLADMTLKGRRAFRVPPADRPTIIRLRKQGVGARDIARLWGVTPTAIYEIERTGAEPIAFRNALQTMKES